jgi:hypothetical protein
MKIFVCEFMKIFTKRTFLLSILLLIILNGVLVWQNDNKQNATLKSESYKRIYKDMESMSEAEKLQFLANKKMEFHFYELIQGMDISQDEGLYQNEIEEYSDEITKYTEKFRKGNILNYTDQVYNEAELYRTVYAKIQQTSQYHQYLKNVQDEAKKMSGVSIFSNPGTFKYRNIQKTAKDFQKLEGNVLKGDISNGIIMALHSDLTDVIMFLILFVVCTQLIFTEKEKGMFALLKPTYKGRQSLIISKLAVLFFASFIIVLSFYGTNLCLAYFKYGFGDVTRLIQSLDGYIGSGLEISVLEYIIVYLLTKVVAIYLVALIIELLCVVSKNVVSIYLGIVGVIGLSYVLYVFIDPTSNLNFFKYVNLYNLINSRGIYIEYLNVNIMSYPISIIPCILTVTLIAILTVFLVTVYLFSNQKLIRLPFFFPKINIHNLIFSRNTYGTKLFYHETWKAFIMQKALLVIMLLIGIQFYTYSNIETNQSSNEFYYKGYMLKLLGESTKEKEVYLLQEQKLFEAAISDINHLGKQLQDGLLTKDEYFVQIQGDQDILKYQNAFQAAKEKSQYIKDLNKTTGKSAWFVYDTGYNQLTAKDSNNTDFTLALLLTIALVSSISSMLAYERSVASINILRTCKYGRGKLFIQKSLISIMVAIPIYIIVYIPQLLYIFNVYGHVGLNAPVCSLLHLANIPFDLTIGQYIIMIYLIRLLAVITTVMIILFVSEISKNTVTAMIISTGVIIMPIIISLLGVSLLNDITLNGILTGNILLKSISSQLKNSSLILIIRILLPSVIAVCLYIYGYLRYAKYRK